MAYYRAGNPLDPVPTAIKTGEFGFNIGKGVWESPGWRSAVGLPAGKPFDWAKSPEETVMGYYRAGDATSGGWQAPMLLPPPSTPSAAATGSASPTGFLAPDRPHHRMNVGNVKALRRSMRRVQGFARLARKVMTFTSHHKMKKHKRR